MRKSQLLQVVFIMCVIVGFYSWSIPSALAAPGDLIWSKTTYAPSEDEQVVPNGVAVDSTGVYIVGDDFSLGAWRMQKRSLTTGNLIWSRSYNPSSYWDLASGVAVDSTGVYIVGSDNSVGGGSQWRMQKRSLTTGSLIWSRSYNPSESNDEANDVAVDSTGVYIVGYYGNDAEDCEWRMQKRSLTTGNLIWSKSYNPSVRSGGNYYDYDAANGVAVDSRGVYIVGNGRGKWIVQKRSR